MVEGSTGNLLWAICISFWHGFCSHSTCLFPGFGLHELISYEFYFDFHREKKENLIKMGRSLPFPPEIIKIALHCIGLSYANFTRGLFLKCFSCQKLFHAREPEQTLPEITLRMGGDLLGL